MFYSCEYVMIMNKSIFGFTSYNATFVGYKRKIKERQCKDSQTHLLELEKAAGFTNESTCQRHIIV